MVSSRKVLFSTCVVAVMSGCKDDPDVDLCDWTSSTKNNSTTAGGDSDGAVRRSGAPILALLVGLSSFCSHGSLGHGLSIPMALGFLAVGANVVEGSEPTASCAAVKEAYKKAGCCDATDKTKVTVAGLVEQKASMYRPGCQSKVVKRTTSGPRVGGTLYVAKAGTKTWKTINGKNYVDLAASSIAAGCTPKHKPHMVRPSPDGRYTAVMYTGDQDFAVVKNDEYKVVYCPDVASLKPRVFGGATHDGVWHTNKYFLLLDMTGCSDGTCGGGIYRFEMTYDAQGAMTKAPAFVDSISMKGVKESRGTAATKPISLNNNAKGKYADLFFVTDVKGAGSILNAKTMKWEKHFTKADFGDCPTGGLWAQPHPTDEKIVMAVYGTQGTATAKGNNCIFKVDMEAKTLTLFKKLADNTDVHGLSFCKTTGGELMLINTNRQTATLDVLKYADASFAVQGYKLNGKAFDSVKADFKKDPDVMKTGDTKGTLKQGDTDKLQPDMAYLQGTELWMSARGPKPNSAVKEANFMANARPGLAVLQIDLATCLPAADQKGAAFLTTYERSPELTSDVHGIWGVRNGAVDEIWAIDQAATGSVETFEVYSACEASGATKEADPK